MRPAGAIAVLGLLAAAPACRTTRLYDPPAIPADPSPERNLAAIRWALLQRGWSIERAVPGAVDAAIVVRGRHAARITITYDTEAIRIAYRDSSNLHYRRHEDGTATIHSNYQSWVNNLHRDIRRHRAAELPR